MDVNYDTVLTRARSPVNPFEFLKFEYYAFYLYSIDWRCDIQLSLYRDEDVKNKDKRFFFANKLICFLNVSDFTCSLDYVKGLKMQKR